MPFRKKPMGVKIPQKDLLNPLDYSQTNQVRLSHQPGHSRSLSSSDFIRKNLVNLK